MRGGKLIVVTLCQSQESRGCYCRQLCATCVQPHIVFTFFLKEELL